MDQAEMEREVPIVFRAKDASSVILTGDFTHWSKQGIRLRRRSSECWMWERWEHLRTPRPRQRYLRELLDLIPIHCLLVTKKKPKAKNSAA